MTRKQFLTSLFVLPILDVVRTPQKKPLDWETLNRTYNECMLGGDFISETLLYAPLDGGAYSTYSKTLMDDVFTESPLFFRVHPEK